MTASRLSFSLAILIMVFGMAWGISMAISHNHETAPGHAHLNLLGWVSLFLMGLFYRGAAQLENSRAAIAQVLVWAIGSILLAAGVALIYSGVPSGEALAAVSSLVLFADMLLFAGLVFRSQARSSATSETAVPAE
ncbi:MAG: hypothetical protein JJ866_20300 [Roseibium sp.]|uniref:hypothetical protein n=1 Tax=Roseibium sp. TaxID=1936156 RepID=UPI001B1C3FA3|nr:hypothetical protein [Roseibium sp.]MBO6510650.1 hypothetical protein [Roseibium sp.]MBO6894295.1 hypothetical protein [Roseibium sp.]MBO6930915.1 hypothetical protein [Roseibium sp.]